MRDVRRSVGFIHSVHLFIYILPNHFYLLNIACTYLHYLPIYLFPCLFLLKYFCIVAAAFSLVFSGFEYSLAFPLPSSFVDFPRLGPLLPLGILSLALNSIGIVLSRLRSNFRTCLVTCVL
ncbi:hypothetical protein V8F20_009141 [Naviculisporaceae sp. PSN 640]